MQLKQDDKRAPSLKNISILLGALTFAAITLGTLWLAFGHHPEKTMYAPAVVQGDGFSFSANFYKGAAVQASRNYNYLIKRSNDGQEISMWATKTNRSLGCGTTPTLDYTPQRTTSILSGCYEEDRKTFATAIRVDRQIYQINLTAKKPVNPQEVREIFGSIVVNK